MSHAVAPSKAKITYPRLIAAEEAFPFSGLTNKSINNLY
jgi:hypothetical protein